MQGPRWVRGPLLAVLGVTPLLTAGAQGAERDKDKLVFGTLHGHSSWSIDAYGLGNRSGPDKAYRFARGEEVDDTSGNAVKLKLPLMLPTLPAAKLLREAVSGGIEAATEHEEPSASERIPTLRL